MEKANWILILGGSSGFGLACAQKFAKQGFNVAIAHKDSQGRVESEIAALFEQMRSEGVEVFSHNGNLSDPDERGEFFAKLTATVPLKSIALFLHSIADGQCKPLIEGLNPLFKKQALDELSGYLQKRGLAITSEILAEGINHAFHEKQCDAFVQLADSRIAGSPDELTEEDLARTIAIMGSDFAGWGRELIKSDLLAPRARLIGLTSEGNVKAWKGYGAVSAAKAALEALARSMALEFAPHDIRTFIVQPGITDTPAGNGIPQFDLMKAHARIRNPFHRLTTTEDVANAIYGMSLPWFDWMNGAVLRIDGGEAIAGG